MQLKTSDWERKQHFSFCNDKIDIVINKEIKDIKKNKDRFTITGNDIEYLNAETIRDIYYSIDTQNEARKECFLEILFNRLQIKHTDKIEIVDGRQYYCGSSAVLFFGLCKIGYITDAVMYLCVNKKNNTATVLEIILKILQSKIDYFSGDDLGMIQKKIQNLEDSGYSEFEKLKIQIDDEITELRFKEVRQKIQSNNIEINNDKKQVQEYLKNFGFESHYNKVLTDVDKYLNLGDEIQLASAIGSFREFFKFFYIDLAKKIAILNGYEEIPKNENSTTEIGYAREYIKKEFNLSSEEKNFFDNYKDITTNNGAHALVKETRYFRLARNIGIEIALFHLSKFEDYKKNKQNKKAT